MASLSYGSATNLSFQLARTGDLVNRLYMKFSLPAIDGGTYVANVGHYLIQCVDVVIGNTKCDVLTSELLFMLEELQGKAGQRVGMDEMIGRAAFSEARILYVPLPFWFAQDPTGLALPLISLQFHDVQFDCDFRSILDCVTQTAQSTPITMAGSTTELLSAHTDFPVQLEAQYVYLDQSERMKFAGAKLEILISQHQKADAAILAGAVGEKKLMFNHAVAELMMVIPKEKLSFGDADSLKSLHLSLNNQARTQERKDAAFYRLMVPYMHHANIPQVNDVYCMSFALQPSDIVQPSGALNFSRIDDAILNWEAAAAVQGGKMHIFARSWNVLRVQVGISGLTYQF